MTIEQLRAKRAEAEKRIRELRDRIHEGDTPREFTAEERESWDAANADFDRLTRQIQIEERAAQVAQIMDDPAAPPHQRIGRGNATGDPDGDPETQARKGPDSETVALAVQGWLRGGRGETTEEQRDAMARCLEGPRPALRIDGRELVVPIDTRRALRERRAQSALQGSLGGYLADDGLGRAIEQALLAFGGLRNVADVLSTSHGRDIPIPTADETTSKGRRVPENTAATTSDLSFGLHTVKAYKYTSDIVLVPRELLEDSPLDLVGYIGERLGERIARAQADDHANGTGAAQPEGIVTGAADSGITATSSSSFTADELMDVYHSLGSAYRSAAMNTGWLMRDTTMKIIRQLKGGDGHYLWGSGLNGSEMNMLLGWPIHLVEEIPAPASGAKSILFGALRKFLIRDVREIRMQRLVERYAESDQDGFVAWHRSDSFVLDAGTNPIVWMDHT